MLKLKNIIDTVRVKYREKMNIVFGRYRRNAGESGAGGWNDS